MNLRRTCLLTIAIFAYVSSARADELRVVKLDITPAGRPEPALRYRLFPSARNMKEGNAAGLCYRAFLELTLGDRADAWEKVSELLELTPEKLPRDEARKVLGSSVSARREAFRAARRRRADWDIPIREDGVDTHLLEVQDARPLGRALALQARLDAVEGRYDAAIESLETAIGLARHISESGTLISSMLGVAVFSIAADEIEHMAALPGSPNLYWALTALPSPLIDVQRGFESEQLWLEGSVPHLKAIETSILSTQQANEVMTSLGTLLIEASPTPTDGAAKPSPESVLAPVIAGYATVKQQLIAQGRDAATLEAMPKIQVVTLRGIQVYRDMLDQQTAFLGRPDPEVRPALARLESSQEAIAKQPEGFLVNLILPAAHSVQITFTRQSQRTELLRVIEALRLYAATHDSKLPAALADIDDVPIPVDPATGKPFDYKTEGAKAILLPARVVEEVRYEITVRK